MNTFGRNLRLTTFGESHGKAIGGIIDGFPPGFRIDFERLKKDLGERRPGASKLVTQRSEPDEPEFLSGITAEGITLGTPIGFIIRNTDHRSSDYQSHSNGFRANHADYTYFKRYNMSPQPGGGRSSARETVNWVVGGSLVLQWLEKEGIHIETALTAVGNKKLEGLDLQLFKNPSLTTIPIPDDLKEHFHSIITEASTKGDSVGGEVSCIVSGLRPGIGNPIFDKISSRLAAAMMTINAAKGFEYGIGYKAASSYGSETTDYFIKGINGISTETNYSGGIQGGISNGMPIFFRISFKPTPTLPRSQKSISVTEEEIEIIPSGRHDPCVALRAVSVVKAMTALVIADFLV